MPTVISLPEIDSIQTSLSEASKFLDNSEVVVSERGLAPANKLEDGWTEYPMDGRGLVDSLGLSLSLQPGYNLRRFRCAWSGGAFNSFYCVPEDQLLEPVVGKPSQETVAGTCKFSSKVKGDGSPLSYFALCMLLRFFNDAGSFWHGINFQQGVFITQAPDLSPLEVRRKPSDDGGPSLWSRFRRLVFREEKSQVVSEFVSHGWKLAGELPSCWLPKVRQSNEQTEVKFYAYKREYGERLLRLTYLFEEGYGAELSADEIGVGPRLIMV